MLEERKCRSAGEIADAEKISFINRLLRLTLLAPDIVEAILDGRQPPAMTLATLVNPFPVVWGGEQIKAFFRLF